MAGWAVLIVGSIVMRILSRRFGHLIRDWVRKGTPENQATATGPDRSVLAVTPAGLVFVGIDIRSMAITGFSTDVGIDDLIALRFGSSWGLDRIEIRFRDGSRGGWTPLRKPKVDLVRLFARLAPPVPPTSPLR